MLNNLTPAQAARRLGITLDAIYKLLYAAKLPGKKVGARWLLPADAVEERLRKRVSHD
jgi:excisionase family DNA binding protein